eukprot:7775157-Pyramimonas_sp.AAC.1
MEAPASGPEQVAKRRRVQDDAAAPGSPAASGCVGLTERIGLCIVRSSGHQSPAPVPRRS